MQMCEDIEGYKKMCEDMEGYRCVRTWDDTDVWGYGRMQMFDKKL